MRRGALRREALRRLDTRTADVAETFDRLTSAQKAELAREVPEFFFATARLVRMRQIAIEMDQ